ncbi:MAG: glyoxalase/bleomycin resistance/dioxygenase family protein [Frankiales bacterium]|nr:glyoxalase/bleomycin resistance/dioxygenase family protein [Frankiales bacterium]
MARVRSVGVAVYALDVDRVAAFYAAVLGLEVAERAEGYAVVRGEQCEVAVVAIPAAIAAGIEIADPPEVRESTPLKPVLLVPSLDAADLVVRAGGALAPGARPWEFGGLRRLDVVDPEGNVVQLAEVAAAD